MGPKQRRETGGMSGARGKVGMAISSAALWLRRRCSLFPPLSHPILPEKEEGFALRFVPCRCASDCEYRE